LALVLAPLAAMAQAPSQDIVDTAVAAGQFKTLASLLQKANLIETLKGPGPFTVFAPSDAAFAKFSQCRRKIVAGKSNKSQYGSGPLIGWILFRRRQVPLLNWSPNQIIPWCSWSNTGAQHGPNLSAFGFNDCGLLEALPSSEKSFRGMMQVQLVILQDGFIGFQVGQRLMA